MVCLHGFTDTWRTWELVLGELERKHEVLAPTLLGHAGGPALEGGLRSDALIADAVERIVWGTEDRLLPLDPAAVGLRTWFPQADWIELEGIGHCPQLDVPLEAAQLILGFTAE
jgi:pimeloyl-ACP methyl ester carboxylesterase